MSILEREKVHIIEFKDSIDSIEFDIVEYLNKWFLVCFLSCKLCFILFSSKAGK